ncbi:MAG: divergent polysaccharide deacetylase family protein [Rhodospirillales bacterium]|jgi:hypothetical protein|nr:divergent polysaccharide deacetylase family protein [Rhodospirillales bacterium]
MALADPSKSSAKPKRKAILGVAAIAAVVAVGAGAWFVFDPPGGPIGPIGLEIPPKIVAQRPPPAAPQFAPDSDRPAAAIRGQAPAEKPLKPQIEPVTPIKIAIVIDDAGIDRKRTRRAISLPGPLTIAFLVYANDVAKQAKAAAAAGHELLVHVNMEAESRAVDPGPNVLLRNVEPDVNLKRLNWQLGRFTGFVGVNNHMGSKFTSDPENMTLVLRELKRRGLLFLDSRTSPKSVGARIALSMGIRTAVRDVFLDNQPELAAVRRNLAKTEKIARRTGSAIAIGHPRDATLDILAEWLPAAAARGIRLVPVSHLASRQAHPSNHAVKR